MNTRRDFLRTSGVAAASLLPIPALARRQAPAPTKKIGYCIVGLGRISLNEFMPGIAGTQNSKLVALVSGHRDKADATAATYGIATANIYDYEHYDEIAHNPEIDAVYIALPNSMHAEYTIRAAKAGKHVLCEKPMANTAHDCEEMIAACRKAQRRLMIAYRCRYQGTHLRAVQIAHDGSIGDLRFIEATFGFSIAKGEWRLNKKLAGGGPLMDVGIYCLNACRYLTNEEPVEIKGYPSVVDQDGRFREVEENVSWSMKFPSGAVASCSTTYGANMASYFRVLGSKGELIVEPAFSYDGQRLMAKIAGEAPIDEPSTMRDPGCFVRQADHFAECVFSNREPG